MVCINIEEQKDWLKTNLTTVLLTEDDKNKTLINQFSANDKGKALEKYLKEYAWKEDDNGSTKVYLVKDKNTENIVFFFALKAGLLYEDIGMDGYDLDETQESIIELCVDYKLTPNNDITVDEVFEWYKDDPEIVKNREKLETIIEERVNVKLAAQDDKAMTSEEINIKRVATTFPGVVLTHFCKNENYVLPDGFLFPLGFYIFWEIIVDKVLNISTMLGCQYLYLFAADRSTRETEMNYVDPMYLYADLDENDLSKEYKLVDYYKNEFKFEDSQRISFLKPYYDFECFSLLQSISKLQENRQAAWIQHSEMEES